jgi:hypothetical protein
MPLVMDRTRPEPVPYVQRANLERESEKIPKNIEGLKKFTE